MQSATLINLNLPLAEAGVTDLFVPVILVLLGVALLIGGLTLVRKRLKAPDADEGAAGGFSMGSLRDLVRQGKMTQAEFDQAKAQIIAATHRAAEQRAATRDVARDAAAAKPGPLQKP